MKICDNCGSASFEDMQQCFDCMGSLAQPPTGCQIGNQETAARLQVALADYFNYELLLQKLDGCSLSVGSASENAIVIPQQQVANHLMQVYYAHGQIWAESTCQTMQATIDETPLCGTVRLQTGTKIGVGEAVITLLEA